MKSSLANIALLGSLMFFSGCASHPGTGANSTTNANGITNANVPAGSHLFQCHPASPGPCAYVVFNESGSVRETFILAPGKARLITGIHPRTAFCLSVEKPLDPTRNAKRLGLDGKPLKKETNATK